MTITSYASLKSEIAAWLGRDDLTDRIDTFIDLTEADFNKRLRVRDMEVAAVTETVDGAETVALPDDFLEMRDLRITNTDPQHSLQWYPIQALHEAYPFSGQNRPRGFAISDDRIYLRPTPDAVYRLRMTYFEKIRPLSDINTTNWMIENDPETYFYGAMHHAAIFMRNTEQVRVWTEKYEAALRLVEDRSRKAYTPRGKTRARAYSGYIT